MTNYTFAYQVPIRSSADNSEIWQHFSFFYYHFALFRRQIFTLNFLNVRLKGQKELQVTRVHLLVSIGGITNQHNKESVVMPNREEKARVDPD